MQDSPHIDVHKVTLTCSIGEDKIIYLTMGGRITHEYLEKFKDWSNEVKGAMVAVSQENNARVFTLIDVTELTNADLVTVRALYELMQFNKRYATKTAVFGANRVISSITHSAIVLTHRYSMKLFPDRTVAMEWLRSEKD